MSAHIKGNRKYSRCVTAQGQQGGGGAEDAAFRAHADVVGVARGEQGLVAEDLVADVQARSLERVTGAEDDDPVLVPRELLVFAVRLHHR